MYILAYDLGTGGLKAALFDESLSITAETFFEYPTFYPGPKLHEQKPSHWWQAVCGSTQALLEKVGLDSSQIGGLALSGASLVAIPLDKEGTPLLEQVPIWSDMRAESQARGFFQAVPQTEWYLATGCGFPPACYSLFKLMWMRENQPEVFSKTTQVVGSKDYINFLLTGRLATDYSYASGTGAFGLEQGATRKDFLRAAGLPEDIFPEPGPSHQEVGQITPSAAAQTGLRPGTPVFCGGVDNACMAMGAVGAAEGRSYVSMGSSAWVPVNCKNPVLDAATRPYTFAHLQEGMYTSAYSLFAGGNSLRWARDVLFPELNKDTAYQEMDRLAAAEPLGAGGVLFHPGLAGGTMQDSTPNLRGAFMNLQLGTSRASLLRAVMEGVAMNLALSLELLRERCPIQEPILFCGGGSKSPVWMDIFADVLNTPLEKSNVDQSAASLGAAAAAARGLGWWKDYTPLAGVHKRERLAAPNPERARQYQALLPLFRQVCRAAGELGDIIYGEKP